MSGFIVMYSPEELKIQARLGQEELVILLEPHLAHGGVLVKHTHTFCIG